MATAAPATIPLGSPLDAARALRSLSIVLPCLVVDDGSTNATAAIAGRESGLQATYPTLHGAVNYSR